MKEGNMDKGMAKSRGNTNESSFGISPVESQGKLMNDVHWMTEEAHAHAYAIPVEWEQKPNSVNGYGDLLRVDLQRPIMTVVTKLRCSCGEEINR